MMTDQTSAGRRHGQAVATSGPRVDAIVSRAISLVALRGKTRPREIDPDMVAHLRANLGEAGRQIDGQAIAPLLAGGLTREEIADHYIPALAREMGEDWVADRAGFAEVSVVVCKLQALLRQLGPEWRADHSSLPSAPTALVLVADDETHTLGAQIASGQLRRAGLSVKVRLGCSRQDLQALLHVGTYDLVLLSAAREESLVGVRRLIETARTFSGASVPMVVGGAVVGTGPDIKAFTGADHSTNDIHEALHLCGATSSQDVRVHLDRRA